LAPKSEELSGLKKDGVARINASEDAMPLIDPGAYKA